MPHGRGRDDQKEDYHKDRVYDQESKKHWGGARKEIRCILRLIGMKTKGSTGNFKTKEVSNMAKVLERKSEIEVVNKGSNRRGVPSND